jgi:hypothetical protein
MTIKRTQVYLDADDHRRLGERARKEGKSMTALLREMVARYLDEGPETAPGRGFDAIVDLAASTITDVASKEREYLDEALERRMRKKLGQSG